MPPRPRRIHIGTSGWHYAHWKGPFYPAGLPNADMLEFYQQRFKSTEINRSFYRLVERDTLKQWYDATPKSFVFAAKGSRFTTHMKRLKDPKASSELFFQRISALEDKLGPILFQLPPRWGFNKQRLADFLNALPSDFRYAFEFRDRSWINEDTFELLEKHDAAFCIYELAGYRSPVAVTTDFVYVRLHGPGKNPYQGSYRKPSLQRWVDLFKRWKRQGRAVYCYFDNDQNGYAARNAMRLMELL